MIGKTIDNWRFYWAYNRRKNNVGSVNDDAWYEYLNSLSVAELLANLALYEEES